jgi:hypothetical protein
MVCGCCSDRALAQHADHFLYRMLLRRVGFPDFCEPCLPSPAAKPPAGAGWLHEMQNMDHFTAAVDGKTSEQLPTETYRGYTYKVAENGEAELRLSSGGRQKFPSTDELKTYVDVLTGDAPRTSDAPRQSDARMWQCTYPGVANSPSCCARQDGRCWRPILIGELTSR